MDGSSLCALIAKTLEALVHVSMTTSICDGEVALSAPHPQREMKEREKKIRRISISHMATLTFDLFAEDC